MISLTMTELNMEERISIRDSARSLKKYGSTSSNSSTKQEHFIKHQVAATDTLQGLALRYGVTTEQIRRANKLWANDSIFLRSSLLIPVPSEGVSSPTDVVLEESDAGQPSSSETPSDTDNSSSIDSFNDFLVKIDCSIASTKSQVMMSQDNSQFMGEDDSLFLKHQSAMSRMKQQRQAARDDLVASERCKRLDRPEHQPLCNGTSDLPTVVTRDRRVRNSLQRLEQTQDSLFEL